MALIEWSSKVPLILRRLVLAERFTPVGAVIMQNQDGAAIPTKRFAKQVIRTGHYIKASDGLEFTVTQSNLVHWALAHQALKKAGVNVPVTFTHDFSGDPRKAAGRVDEMWIDGDALMFSCTLVGNDAIRATQVSDVSLYSPPEFTDGHGTKHVRPILHIALCTDPAVPGLADFVPLAASRGVTMSNGGPNNGVKPMDLEWLKKVATALGIDASQLADAAAVQAAINAKLESPASASQNANPASTSQSSTPPANPSQPAIKNETTTREFAASQSNGSDAGKAKVSPLVVKSLVASRTTVIDSLVTSRKIKPAQADALKKQYADAESLTLCLSQDVDDGFDSTIALLSQNDAAPDPNEKTGPQSYTLSDGRKGGGNDSATDNVMTREADRRAKVQSGK